MKSRRSFPKLKCIAFLTAFSFLGCATIDDNKKIFDFLTEDHAGYGAEVNQNPSKLGRLFDLPSGFYPQDESNSPQKPSNTSPEKGWLGIAMKKPDQPVREPGTDQTLPAVEVHRVFPYSTAQDAGIKDGDKIIGFDGQRLSSNSKDSLLPDFNKMIEAKSVGNQARLKILRDGKIQNITVTFKAKPKTAAKLGPHPALVKNRGRFPNSLLHYALKKEKLAKEFARTVEAIRNTTTDVVSLLIKGEDYNPFRLQKVNYIMHYPLHLPMVAHAMTEDLHKRFNPEMKDLSGMIRDGMKALDLAYLEPPHTTRKKPADLFEYIEQLVEAVSIANRLREEALVSLSPEEIDTLYEDAAAMLKEDLDEIKEEEKEKTEEEKRQTEEDLVRFYKVALKVDLSRLLSAAAYVAQAIDLKTLAALKIDGHLLNRSKDGWTVQEQENLTTIQTPVGKVFIGGAGTNNYMEDAAIIIDIGGADHYLNRAGGSSRKYPFSIVIDLSGNDLYASGKDFAQGAGLLGGGFLIDLEGHDLYSAQNYSQGAGIFGVGLLVDLAGGDEYKSDAVSQGAAAFGIGILAEGGGSDHYSATRFSQGFGFVKGYGALVEVKGADNYFAGGKYPDFRDPEKSYGSLSQGFGLGSRPADTFAGASGGIGILADAEGNDTYVGDYFSQGASYWFALGILADKKGHDKYIAGRYSQGAGTHSTAGILMDGEGDDQYLAYFGVSQGCGHDYAIGMLLDNGGNDLYIGGVISQGAGNDNGIGILNDNGGDDEYYIKALGHGRGNFHQGRKLGSFGLHFDTGGGNDYYSPNGKNNQLIFKTSYGIFADTR